MELFKGLPAAGGAFSRQGRRTSLGSGWCHRRVTDSWNREDTGGPRERRVAAATATRARLVAVTRPPVHGSHALMRVEMDLVSPVGRWRSAPAAPRLRTTLGAYLDLWLVAQRARVPISSGATGSHRTASPDAK